MWTSSASYSSLKQTPFIRLSIHVLFTMIVSAMKNIWNLVVLFKDEYFLPLGQQRWRTTSDISSPCPVNNEPRTWMIFSNIKCNIMRESNEERWGPNPPNPWKFQIYKIHIVKFPGLDPWKTKLSFGYPMKIFRIRAWIWNEVTLYYVCMMIVTHSFSVASHLFGSNSTKMITSLKY